MRRAAFLFATILGVSWIPVSPTAVAADWVRAPTGEWKLVWSISEAIGDRNLFPDLGLEVDFPVRWRHLQSSSGSRLVLFDEIGRGVSEIPLAPKESVLASPDGAFHVRWTADRDDRNVRHLSYWITGRDSPVWEASALGEPVLLAPDGGVLAVSTQRSAGTLIGTDRTGIVQVIGAGGELRQELPFAPLRSAFTADARRLVFFRSRELVVLERDGSLAWTRTLPIEDVPAREGPSPVSCGGSRIAVCGTGAPSANFRGGGYLERPGRLSVYGTNGQLQWELRQKPGEESWFSASSRLSPDGEYLVTARTGARGTTISLHDGADGKLLWSRLETRRVGLRTISLTAGGERVAMIHGGPRTHALVLDLAGDVIFEGLLPLEGKRVEIVAGDLLVADRWVVLLRFPDREPDSGPDPEPGAAPFRAD